MTTNAPTINQKSVTPIGIMNPAINKNTVFPIYKNFHTPQSAFLQEFILRAFSV